MDNPPAKARHSVSKTELLQRYNEVSSTGGEDKTPAGETEKRYRTHGEDGESQGRSPGQAKKGGERDR